MLINILKVIIHNCKVRHSAKDFNTSIPAPDDLLTSKQHVLDTTNVYSCRSTNRSNQTSRQSKASQRLQTASTLRHSSGFLQHETRWRGGPCKGKHTSWRQYLWTSLMSMWSCGRPRYTGLSCKRDSDRSKRHHQLNNLIWSALGRAPTLRGKQRVLRISEITPHFKECFTD